MAKSNEQPALREIKTFEYYSNSLERSVFIYSLEIIIDEARNSRMSIIVDDGDSENEDFVLNQQPFLNAMFLTCRRHKLVINRRVYT